MCRNSGYEFHKCPKRKRKITNSDAAEIDVDFTIELTKPKLESVVSWDQTPYYSDLFEPTAQALMIAGGKLVIQGPLHRSLTQVFPEFNRIVSELNAFYTESLGESLDRMYAPGAEASGRMLTSRELENCRHPADSGVSIVSHDDDLDE